MISPVSETSDNAMDMMRNISRDDGDFLFENISSKESAYGCRITLEAFWRLHGMFKMTFCHLIIRTFVVENVAEMMLY